jgi:hypothetical protein
MVLWRLSFEPNRPIRAMRSEIRPSPRSERPCSLNLLVSYRPRCLAFRRSSPCSCDPFFPPRAAPARPVPRSGSQTSLHCIDLVAGVASVDNRSRRRDLECGKSGQGIGPGRRCQTEWPFWPRTQFQQPHAMTGGPCSCYRR